MKSKVAVAKRMLPVLFLLTSWTYGFAQTSVDEIYHNARDHLIEERYEKALQAFRSIVDKNPNSDKADDAQYYIGYTLEEMGRYAEAIEAYETMLSNWPDSLRAESARLHRNELLSQRPGGSPEIYEEVFQSSGSWELKRDTALALARQGDLRGANVLEETMRRGSSSRQLELVKILERKVQDPVARRILIIGLEPSRSSSVKLLTLEALEPVARDPEVLRAIQNTVSERTSSSVSMKAIQVLGRYVDNGPVRSAIASGLSEGNSSSVQIAACDALKGHLLDPDVRPEVIRLMEGSTSSSVQMKALSGLEQDQNNPEVAEVLKAAVANRNSSSVKIKAMSIAGTSSSAEVRAVARAGLASEASSSVQLRAVQAFAEGRNEPQASEALEELFRTNGTSTSVQLAALGALSHHMDTPAAPKALAKALDLSNSTSVQLKAMELAAEYIQRPDVRNAVLELLNDSSTSTSVQLEAIKLLGPSISDQGVSGIVSAALRPSNSTSVQLEAVDALSSVASSSEVRQALMGTLHRQYSTSVILKSMETLDDYVAEDAAVQDAYKRVMQDEKMSSTARVRAAERLVPGADGRLKEQISDAMEDVIVRLSRRQGFHGDILDEAFDVLEDVDPERAQSLGNRYGGRRSYLRRESERLAENTGLGDVWLNLDTLALWAELVSGGMPESESSQSAAVHLGTKGLEAVRKSVPPFLTGRLFYY